MKRILPGLEMRLPVCSRADEQTDIRRKERKQKEKYGEEGGQKIYGCPLRRCYIAVLQLPSTEEGDEYADKKYKNVDPCNIVPEEAGVSVEKNWNRKCAEKTAE